MDALTTLNLKDALRLEEKSTETFKKDLNKMNRTACDVMRFYLTPDIKYHLPYENSARKT